MTRLEYMRALKEKLQNYDPELAREILDDYEMHFAEGLAAGHSEEEIIRELGSVDDMLQEFTAEDRKVDLATVDSQSHLQQQFDSLYRAVVIDCLLADVTVSASTDGHLKVDYQNNSSAAMKLRYRFYQYEKDGIFYVGVEETDYKSKAGVLSYIMRYGRGIHLSVEIPAGIPVVKLSSRSGDMKIENLHLSDSAETKLEMQTDSGNIDMTQVSTNIFSAKSQSGDIFLKNLEGKEISLQCTSGDIDGTDVNCDTIVTQVVSGDVELELAAKTCNITVTSGDIDLAVRPGVREIELIAVSGDISLDLRKVDGASVEISNQSGDTTIRGKSYSGDHYRDSYGDGSCKVNIVNSSGDVDIL